jgi:hypothetical protein
MALSRDKLLIEHNSLPARRQAGKAGASARRRLVNARGRAPTLSDSFVDGDARRKRISLP